jgi:hypothetical protein
MPIITEANYQQIAKAAVGAPSFANDDDYISLVKSTALQLAKLGVNAQLAVEAAYIFSRKVPYDERQDLFQELVAAILDSETENAAFAYTIARRDWQDWWRSYKTRSHTQ